MRKPNWAYRYRVHVGPYFILAHTDNEQRAFTIARKHKRASPHWRLYVWDEETKQRTPVQA